MNNIINFPIRQKIPKPLPRQRVFYIGYRYVGPTLCQEIQQLYLKRKGRIYGDRWWAIITYGKYQDTDTRNYSIELEECMENDVPDMLDMFDVGAEVSFADLELMGWRGQILRSAKIFNILHKCYEGVVFPNFVKPLNKHQFGTKIMAQSTSAISRLKGKKLFTKIKFSEHDDWIWMNLDTYDCSGYKVVPVKLVKHLHG